MNAVNRPQETATVTRMTAEGRKLSYELKVIQQPERARACGSGAKCEHNASQQSSPSTPY